ncbi:MAG: NUDIX domain-containing protein [Parcubacteria group bacterium]|jgi:ADP-ribose pyrophosphatase YjhB (NUDIX family)
MQKIIIASGPVIVENNKVLLDQHGDTNFWKFCGGRVENDWGLIETAHKRPKEELGIDIEILDENPFISYAVKENPEGKMDVILVHFLAKRIGEIKPGKDIREWNWFDLDNLPENLGPNIIPALKHFNFIK